LIDLIHDPDLDTAAIRALGEIGNPAAIKPLLPFLEDKDRYRREASAGALGQLKAREAFEPLIRLLDDEYGFVRLMALSAITLIGETYDLPIEPYLHRMLRDESKSVRMLAEIKLEKFGKTS
jgi:HEAT repeat protein